MIPGSVLITGGTGAFGQASARRLLQDEKVSRIAILSRGEFRQYEMAQELAKLDAHKKLRFFIGDVRDKERLARAMQGIRCVVHAAALKRIEVGHYNPIEMVKTNVMGSANVIEAAIDAGVERAVLLSSDKAFQPISPYGTSKALAESLFLAANNISGGRTRFAVTRYGNVWGSTGSVVPLWEKEKTRHEDEFAKYRLYDLYAPESMDKAVVSVTNPDCTRFFMRMDEAVDLVIQAIDTMPGKEPLIPILPAYRLGDLAEAMDVKMDVIGLPTWEKMHESMSEGQSSDRARRLSVKELQEILNEPGN